MTRRPDDHSSDFPSVAQLRSLLDSNLLGMVFYTPLYDAAGTLQDFRFAYLNPAGQRILGVRGTPTLTYRQQFPSNEGQGDGSGWVFHRDTFLSGEVGHDESYYQADGYDAYYRVRGQRVGRGLLLSFTDTSDHDRSNAEQVLRERQARAQAEQQQLRAIAGTLVETNRRLARTNADLDMFVYTASHDLRTPIHNIAGLLTALREELPPASAAVLPLLDLLDGAVVRFQETLRHLADLGQMQQATNAPAEAVAVTALIEAVAQDLAAQVHATGTQLTLDVPVGLRAHLVPATLRSIVFNLLSNALKYHDPCRPSQVQVTARARPTYLLVEVRDTGLGLSTAQQERLFKLFERLHAHVDGSGVGLYAIKRLIENAGGTIQVESEVGVGSVFRVRLPVEQGAAVSAATASPAG